MLKSRRIGRFYQKMPNSRQKFRFAAFEVDSRAKELRKHNTKLKLHRQSFEVLLLLIEHPGEVVTREEVREKLWPDETFVDFEHGVNTAINKVRQALCDSPDKPRYIETVPRVGYRFLAPVENLTRQDGRRVILVVLPFENLNGDPAQEYFTDGLTEETITDLSVLASERLGIIARTSAMPWFFWTWTQSGTPCARSHASRICYGAWVFANRCRTVPGSD